MNIREMIEEAKKPMSEEEREAARVRWAEAHIKYAQNLGDQRLTKDWLDRTYDI